MNEDKRQLQPQIVARFDKVTLYSIHTSASYCSSFIVNETWERVQQPVQLRLL
jgi:hypothetical protein